MMDFGRMLKFILMAYFTSWNTPTLMPFDIPAKCLTHVNYAFADISNGVIVHGNPNTDAEKIIKNPKWQPGQPEQFKGVIDALTNPNGPVAKCNPNLKYLISVGGWTHSSEFSIVARTPDSRRIFARSVIDYLHQYNFNGLDIDWEFPIEGGLPTNAVSPNDKENFVLLLQEIRRQMDTYQEQHQHRGRLLLTAATTVSRSLARNLDLPAMERLLDWFNLMIYDFAGPWENVTAHNAPFRPGFVDAVDLYLNSGIERSKMVTGVPLYGRRYFGVESQLPGSPYTSVNETPSFDDIQANFTADKGYQRFWDDAADARYIWNRDKKEWITYEDPRSAFIKAEYVRQQQLEGVFLWELSFDRAAVILQRILKGLGFSQPYHHCFC